MKFYYKRICMARKIPDSIVVVYSDFLTVTTYYALYFTSKRIIYLKHIKDDITTSAAHLAKYSGANCSLPIINIDSLTPANLIS